MGVAPRWFATVVGALLAIGCGSLQNASAGHVGCRPSEVVITNDNRALPRTWTATCHGRQYSCSIVGDVACSPMDSDSGYIGTHGDSSASRHRRAKVNRGFDEARGIAYVRGTFGVAPRVDVVVMGAPTVAVGRIAVSVIGPAVTTPFDSCRSLDVMVNAQPSTTDQNIASAGAGRARIESKFAVEVFRPLATRYPEFAIRACGTTWKFTPEQVAELQKLLVMYSDMSAELPDDPDANAQPAPGQTSL